MKLTVKCFAAVADIVGSSRIELTVEDFTTVLQLKRMMIESHPELARLKSALLFAVNGEYASADRVLQAEDEVACIPPVSGG